MNNFNHLISKNTGIVKILFLDVDGVLNSHNFYKNEPQHEQIENLKKEYPGLESSVYWELSCFDKKAVERLNRLLEETNCYLIVSSTWRLDSNLPTTFKRVGIKHKIDGITPYLPGKYRGNEIKQFLDNIKGKYTYCILDDDSDMLPEQEPYFIHTSIEIGLTEDDVNKAIKILNRYDEH